MKRMFFALWPDDDTRERCRQIIRAVRSAGRPVSANNLHITLVFLGSVDAPRQAAMTETAANLVIRPMSLTFDRLAYWKKPAVLCLCAEQTDPVVSDLVKQLNIAAVENGIDIDQRPYRPHVTLLRKAKSPSPIEFEPIVWRADSFCLVQSCSTPAGVEYRVIDRWLPHNN